MAEFAAAFAREAWPKHLSRDGGTGAARLPAFRPARWRRPLRCHRRAGRRRRHAASEPDLCGPAFRHRRSTRHRPPAGARLLRSKFADVLRAAIVGSRRGDQPGIAAIIAAASPSADGSYHQGPVWGWLLGHWALAHHRVHGDAAAAQAWLEPIADHLHDAALGQVSEIFDGDPPHTPRGAPAQAWSVACVLEAWWRLERAKRQG